MKENDNQYVQNVTNTNYTSSLHNHTHNHTYRPICDLDGYKSIIHFFIFCSGYLLLYYTLQSLSQICLCAKKSAGHVYQSYKNNSHLQNQTIDNKNDIKQDSPVLTEDNKESQHVTDKNLTKNNNKISQIVNQETPQDNKPQENTGVLTRSQSKSKNHMDAIENNDTHDEQEGLGFVEISEE